VRRESKYEVRVSAEFKREVMRPTAQRFGLSYTEFTVETYRLFSELAAQGFTSIAEVREVLLS